MAKALWDDENLYVAFICEDALIWTEHTKRDTSVGEDDTVEVFTVSNPEHPQAYLNIEMNVQGIFLDQFHPDGLGVPVEEEWNGEGIQIKTSIVGILNDDKDEDQCLILKTARPFRFKNSQTAPYTHHRSWGCMAKGLNRLGGKTNQEAGVPLTG